MYLEIDPRPRFSTSRMLAGAFGGAVGGLAFALVMAAALIVGPEDLQGTHMSAMLARLLQTDNMLVVWAAHLGAAIVFGLVFSLFVAPRRVGRAVGFAVAYSVLLWALGAFLSLRLLTGSPLTLDTPGLLDLAGHLLFGLLLGVVYVAFFRQEAELPRGAATKA